MDYCDCGELKDDRVVLCESCFEYDDDEFECEEF